MAGIDQQAARNICGAMMFSGNSALKKISVLSGGEKSRVLLGKILVTPLNLLLLDEPTNHLDMDSCDALLAAIDSFEGTVIMVTHNEMFLHALAERLVVFQDDGITVFEGSYNQFLRNAGWSDEQTEKKASTNKVRITEPMEKLTKKEARKKRSEMVAERGRLLNPLKKKIRFTENDIEQQEEHLNTLNQKMMKASETGNGADIAAISKKIHACNNTIEKRFAELEVLHEEKDSLDVKYKMVLDS